MARPVIAACRWLLLSLLLSGGATAGELSDPTRPPAGWGASETPGTAAPPPAGHLQMIVRAPGERPWALIDGRRVNIGDQVDGERLVLLSGTEAVFRGTDGSRRLSLTPGVTRVPRHKPQQETR